MAHVSFDGLPRELVHFADWTIELVVIDEARHALVARSQLGSRDAHEGQAELGEERLRMAPDSEQPGNGRDDLVDDAHNYLLVKKKLGVSLRRGSPRPESAFAQKRRQQLWIEVVQRRFENWFFIEPRLPSTPTTAPWATAHTSAIARSISMSTDHVRDNRGAVGDNAVVNNYGQINYGQALEAVMADSHARGVIADPSKSGEEKRAFLVKFLNATADIAGNILANIATKVITGTV